jgi:pimeloyl-ACP methyl ester carboxylesterase
MDGTGKLFTEFLLMFNGDYLVMPLPHSGPQDYVSLAKVIHENLPTEDYILLAESFSGGIVPELLKLNPKNIKGVIFVASFLSSPHKFLLSIAKLLPIKFLASAPFSNIAHKLLFLGQEAPKELLTKFVEVVKSIPNPVLKNRVDVMRKQQLPITSFDIPTLYIQALSDRLISSHKALEVRKVFTNTEYKEIKGPHFILQTKPKESALLVNKFIQSGKF